MKYGYIELTPENAKIYGDSFLLGEMQSDKCKKNLVTGISGEKYLADFIDHERQDITPYYDDSYLNYYYVISEDDLKTPLMKKEEYKEYNELVAKAYKKKTNEESMKEEEQTGYEI